MQWKEWELKNGWDTFAKASSKILFQNKSNTLFWWVLWTSLFLKLISTL